MNVFITGIGTDVGKTVVSAILAEAFHANYWKPVQTGVPDTDFFGSLISNQHTRIFPPAYTFSLPASPHIAAAAQQCTIDAADFVLPRSAHHLIVEGAGGLMVPLNDHFLMVDLIEQLKLPVILVSRHYLGSINHTLLSIELLKKRNIPLLGIIFNGNRQDDVEKVIIKRGNTVLLERINDEALIDRDTVLRYASVFSINEKLSKLFA